MFKVLAYGATHVGRERKNNEDAYRIAGDAGLFIVCDGMGGHASGEVASQIAADAMVRFVEIESVRPGFRWPFEVQHQTTEEARVLDAAVRLANVEVFASATTNPAHKGMGTTIAGVLAGPSRLGLVHVGDSRIYRLRGHEFEQLTDDHSLLNHYIRTRPMSAQQIRQFAGKNVIVRAVGLRDSVEPDVQVQDYRKGDVYLLCSDGLTDMVEDELIGQTLLEGRGNLGSAAERLVGLALDGGGKDNITLVLLHVVEAQRGERSAVASGETEPMHSLMEDTSPGFDIRSETQAFADEETLPEISLTNVTTTEGETANRAGQPRPFERTQPVSYKPWLPGMPALDPQREDDTASAAAAAATTPPRLPPAHIRRTSGNLPPDAWRTTSDVDPDMVKRIRTEGHEQTPTTGTKAVDGARIAERPEFTETVQRARVVAPGDEAFSTTARTGVQPAVRHEDIDRVTATTPKLDERTAPIPKSARWQPVLFESHDVAPDAPTPPRGTPLPVLPVVSVPPVLPGSPRMAEMTPPDLGFAQDLPVSATPPTVHFEDGALGHGDSVPAADAARAAPAGAPATVEPCSVGIPAADAVRGHEPGNTGADDEHGVPVEPDQDAGNR